jgi:hypothetical protein
MSLFNIVPDNFFKILTTANRVIYLESLLSLYAEFKDSSYMLTKIECTVILSRYFDQKIYDLQPEEDEPIPSNKTVYEYCNVIIRHLTKYQWLQEQDDIENREVYLSMPPYASALLETINEIINPDNSKTDNCVINIYLNLKGILTEGNNEYMFLENAYDGTVKLNRLLQDIIHNMKLHFNSLLKQASIAGVLVEHFNEYERNIIDKSYHPLKTENNAFKYRTEIQKIIRELRYSDELQEKMMHQFKLYKKLSTEEEARHKVFIYLDEIMRTFDNVDGKLKQIDKKHNQYLHTSWDRLKYLSNRNKDLQGNIVKVIQHIVENSYESSQIVKDINNALNLSDFRALTEKSVSMPRIYKLKFTPEPLAIEPTDDKEAKNRKQKILNEYGAANSEFSRDNIEIFLEKHFDGKDIFNTKDIVITDDMEFLKLVIAVNLYNKPSSKYSVNISDTVIKKGRYTIPEIQIGRRIANANE